METELKSLRIDPEKRRAGRSRWASRWIVAGVALFLLLGAGRFILARAGGAREVETLRVAPVRDAGETVILNAAGYIVAAHKIEVASKVVGRVAWIGVDKGDRVRQGQVIVRLEDDEYRAQLQQAQGQSASLQARLLELQNGSRPEEIARAGAQVEQAQADLQNAKVNLDRTRTLVREGVAAKQQLDDAQARYDSQVARVTALERDHDLARIGPRQEQIAAVRGQIQEAQGRVAFFETQLANTVIKAPVSGTILDRNVETGEFVTTGFVGDRGAKGFVVTLADLNDLEVELDISQSDFAKLGPAQRGTVSTDAYPDRKYEGVIHEVSPEANRQKATVQVKVKVAAPDGYLRPEMNANVAFLAEPKGQRGPEIVVPTTAVRGNAVFVLLDGKAVRRAIQPAGSTAKGLKVARGLSAGEVLLVNPPEDLKEGDAVRART